MASSLVVWSYVSCTVAVTGFGVYALLLALIRHRRLGKDTTEFFLTARRSTGVFRIAWSFYAATLGAWVMFALPSYAYGYGIVGLVMYATSCGLPILLQGFLGPFITGKLPNVMSFSDFVQKRFGSFVMVWVTFIMLLNMGIVLTAEMTAVGALFSDVIGVTSAPMVVTVALVSIVYTAGGGLFVSIVTDQVQSGLSLILLAVVILYVAVTLREALPTPLPPTLGVTYRGYASIASLPISLITASLFTESIWQRCWASASDKSLRIASVWGALQVILVTFLFGFGGFLAAWSGKFVPSGPDDYGNTIFFSLFKDSNGNQVVWITVVVAVLTVTLSESAQDSLQNALTSCIAGVFLSNRPVMWSRALVVILSVPCLVVSLRGYNIMSLFQLGNLMTATSAVPVTSGLFTGPMAELIVTPVTVMCGCWSGFFAVVVYAALRKDGWGLSMSRALHSVFLDIYDWPQFVIALVASAVGLLVASAVEIPLRRLLGIPRYRSAISLVVEEEKRPMRPSLKSIAEAPTQLDEGQSFTGSNSA